MNSRTADCSKQNFQNNMVKIYTLITRFLRAGNEKKTFLSVLVNVLRASRKNKKVVFLIVWVLNWIKHVFELFQRKIKDKLQA